MRRLCLQSGSHVNLVWAYLRVDAQISISFKIKQLNLNRKFVAAKRGGNNLMQNLETHFGVWGGNGVSQPFCHLALQIMNVKMILGSVPCNLQGLQPAFMLPVSLVLCTT